MNLRDIERLHSHYESRPVVFDLSGALAALPSTSRDFLSEPLVPSKIVLFGRPVISAWTLSVLGVAACGILGMGAAKLTAVWHSAIGTHAPLHTSAERRPSQNEGVTSQTPIATPAPQSLAASTQSAVMASPASASGSDPQGALSLLPSEFQQSLNLDPRRPAIVNAPLSASRVLASPIRAPAPAARGDRAQSGAPSPAANNGSPAPRVDPSEPSSGSPEQRGMPTHPASAHEVIGSGGLRTTRLTTPAAATTSVRTPSAAPQTGSPETHPAPAVTGAATNIEIKMF
jgi:hypothetical protein